MHQQTETFLLSSARHLIDSQVDEILDTKLDELEDGVGEVRSENFRVGLLLEFVDKVLLSVESEALARPRPTGTTGPLLSGCLGDRGNKQRLDSNPRVVDFLLEESRVNDVDDTIDRQRRLGDVGRDDDLATWSAASDEWRWGRVEDTLLLLRGKRRVERHDEKRANETARVLAELIRLGLDFAATVLNLFLSCQEEKYVTLVLGLVDHEDSSNGGLDIVIFRLLRVERLDREGSARNLEKGRLARVGTVTKVLLELERVKRSRHDDDLEVLASTGDLVMTMKIANHVSHSYANPVRSTMIPLSTSQTLKTAWSMTNGHSPPSAVPSKCPSPTSSRAPRRE